jgi:RNA polymerase sigma-70 factor (ECF subfamily)
VVGERLHKVHRQHLGTQARAVGREVSLYRGAVPQASSAALAAQLLDRHTSPTDAVLRAERIGRVQQALDSLQDVDREIVALRIFKQLSCAEAAQVLGIGKSAAAKRYIRAMKRLGEALGGCGAGQ